MAVNTKKSESPTRARVVGATFMPVIHQPARVRSRKGTMRSKRSNRSVIIHTPGGSLAARV
jgi:hypothetical protein